MPPPGIYEQPIVIAAAPRVCRLAQMKLFPLARALREAANDVRNAERKTENWDSLRAAAS